MKLRRSAVDIGLVVKNLDEMKRFYGEGLGFERVFSESPPPDVLPPARTVHSYQAGEAAIKLWHIHDQTPPSGPDERLGQTGFRYLTMWIDENLDSVVARLTELGFPVEDKPHRSVLGAPMSLCFLRDPDGNYIEMIETDDPSGEMKRDWAGVADEFRA
jgi:catechol 2,3-dioxygenase-like lactoylglutathione lyase family enzyme